MLNKIILKGNMGRAPKVGLTQDGREIATFSLATSVSWKDIHSEWQTCTEWHRITVFRESTVRWIKDILKKGDTLYVEGRLSYHQWTDKYGQLRLTPHIVVSNREGRIEYLRSYKETQVGTSLETNPLATRPCPQSTNAEGSQQQETN